MSITTSELPKLDTRRKALRITVENLSKMSGCSPATVRRVLRGDYGAASFDTVQSIAQALGMRVQLKQEVSVPAMRRRQALQKAEKLLKLVQATSSLEGQGLDDAALKERTELMAQKLLGGSSRKLWDAI